MVVGFIRYNMSKRNTAFFVDHKGDPMSDPGQALALATKHFSGTQQTLTCFRKLLTTEVFGLHIST